MSVLHDVAHFMRWKLIAVRYAGKLKGLSLHPALSEAPPRTGTVERVRRDGHDTGPKLPAATVLQINQIYRPRIDSVVARPDGHPFVNLFRSEDMSPDNPVFRIAFSTDVLDVADDYFSGRLILDSIQVLYSWPTSGALRESQKWHKDYGDSKSFHWISYLNDVRGPDDGPFGFVDKADTRRIGRSAFIRRIGDEQFSHELGSGTPRQFLGAAGDSVFVDPAVCYHYGSRCRNARLALFVTFNTNRPFVRPTPLIGENREQILHAARIVRPDLSERFLRSILQLGS